MSDSHFVLILSLQIHKIIGFSPSLLQVIMMNDIDMPVRQAGELTAPR